MLIYGVSIHSLGDIESILIAWQILWTIKYYAHNFTSSLQVNHVKKKHSHM